MSAPIGRVLAGVAGVLAPALAAVVAMALVVGVPAAAAHGRDDALRTWAAGDGRDAIVVVQARATDSVPNAAGEAAIVAAVAPVPVLTRHVFATAPLAATWEGGAGDLVLAALRPEEGVDLFFDRSGRAPLGGIAAGRMPQAGDEAIIDAPAAQRLDLEVGDEVRIGDREAIEIVGVWSPSSAGLRLLRAVGLDGGGGDGGGLITTVDAVFVGDSAPYERWALEVDPTRFDSASLRSGPGIVDGITASLAATGIPTAGIVVDDTLTAELHRLETGVASSGRILAGFTVVGATIAAVALVQIGGLLASARSAELAVIRTRGASRSRIATAVGTVVGLAALAGATIAAAIIGLLAVVGVLVVDPLTLLVAPLAFALLAGIAVGVACAIRSGAHASRRGVIARAAGPLALVAVVVVASLAILGLWTESAASPLAVASPAIALVGAVAVCLVLVRPVARMLAGGRIRGSSGLVAARRIARRPQRFAPVMAIIAMQVGLIVLAAATTGSAQTISAEARALDAGAAVRVVGVGSAEHDAAGLGASVLTERLEWGGEGIDLVAITASGAASTIEPVLGVIDPAAIASGLAVQGAIGAAVGDGPATVSVASSRPATLWFADAAGTLITASADPGTATVDLPIGTDWQLLAIEARPDVDGRWRLDALTVDGTPIAVEAWGVSQDRAGVDGITAAATAVDGGLTIDAALVPTGLAVAPVGSIATKPVRLVPAEPTAVPAVIDRAVADAGGLEPGDVITARVSGAGREVAGVVSRIVPAIPGTGSVGGIMLELRTSIAQQLRIAESPLEPDERWFSSVDAPAAAAIPWPEGTTVRTAAAGVHDRLVATAITAAWASVAIALLLTAIALIAAVGQRVRLDRPDAAAMRAMGVDAAGIRSAWMRETAPIAAAAVVIGAVAGLATAAGTVPIVTWRAVPVPPVLLEPVITVEPIGLVLALGALLVLIVVVIGRGAVATARSAVTQGEGSSR